MDGARKRRLRGRFYGVLDAVNGILAAIEPRVRECERRWRGRIERREDVRDLDHGQDGYDQRLLSNSRIDLPILRRMNEFSDTTKVGGVELHRTGAW